MAVDNMSSDMLVVTMDMQSVLLCPKLLVSEQYYKQKLAIHNFTFYVKNTKDVYLYVWHEGEGGVNSNNITTCVLHFLQQYCISYKKVVLISDGCTYQNRNKVLCSALANFSSSRDVEIQQIILEKGHTMMEVDSVHSTLEQLFSPPIYSPADYIHLMRRARPSQPYIINYLDYTFFKDYEHLPDNYRSIRPGRKTGDPTVCDIRALLFKNNAVMYKLRHTEEWKPLPQQRNQEVQADLKALYTMPLTIDTNKFNSLQSLKQFMHRDYHHFYDNLYH